jgi:hypothetical protein
MFKINLKKILLTTALGIALSSTAVLAAGILPPESGSVPGTCNSANGCGNYSLNDMVLLAVNIANWILGVVGSVALLFFIYGGFVFIFSGGNEKKIEEGKQILIGAVVGLLIVFSSYLIIQFVMSLLGFSGTGLFNGKGSWTNLKQVIQILK